jgi:Domain of unknown function (DUF4252)
MRWNVFTGTVLVCVGMSCGMAAAQANSPSKPAAGLPEYQSSPNSGPIYDAGPQPIAPLNPVPLEWTPPALAQLSRTAAMKTSFTLDRNMLDTAAAVLPDEDGEARMALRKLDGVSVHLLRFGQEGMIDPAEIGAIRESYHLRGWKHLVTTSQSGGPVRNNHTDVWLVMDGVTVKGAVVLAETPRSVTLVTVAGNINPIDILHLRGHFGIPRFDRDAMRDERVQ